MTQHTDSAPQTATGPIHELMDCVDILLQELTESINGLDRVLSPILSPKNNGGRLVGELKPTVCPMHLRLQSQGARVESSLATIREIMARVNL